MTIIDRMPAVLAIRNDVPKWLEVGYAMWTLRSMLGRGSFYYYPVEFHRDMDGKLRAVRWAGRRFETVEEEALANIIVESGERPVIEIQDYRTEEAHDLPRIRANFLHVVDSIIAVMQSDGSCMVRNKRGVLERTTSATKIANDMNVLPAAVREAQRRVKRDKAG